MNPNEFLFFSGFILFIILMLSLDLGILNKKDHIISTKEALAWTACWVFLALSFYLVIRFYGDKIHGIDNIEELQAVVASYRQKVEIIPDNLELSLQNYRRILSLEYITGYIIEESLSIDNIFVIILIFNSFGVQKKYFHRVLFWGIIGALIFRCIFIFTGAFLVAQFSWILYLFAIFLIYTGGKILFSKNSDDNINPARHPVVRFASKYFTVSPKMDGNKFFIKENGKTLITPLFLVLLIVEFSDLIFAVDSIPAIFVITKDPYIIFFSNIFAILGLRSMFFVLINVINKFHFFKIGLALLLVYIGFKMIFAEYLYESGFTIMHSLGIIISILVLCILASLIFPKKHAKS